MSDGARRRALPGAESRIVLVRHGRSAHVQSGWIDAAGFRSWREAYEAAGVDTDERPPADLARLAAAAAVIACSDVPRAVASARLLAPERELVVSPLLRELELAAPVLGRLRMPLVGWAVAVGLRKLLLTLFRRHRLAAEAARIEQASAWLQGLASAGSPLVVVTHASLRRELGDRLVRAGWRPAPAGRSLRHWSAWAYSRPLP